ncbi:MAG: response regulator transcription factor [Actinobacteria bacterium]|nr:response regulator transcription factor [Actinomycetota bacterium]MCL6105545.1 response regulator transcription factor [Actinomycetota bacterium]
MTPKASPKSLGTIIVVEDDHNISDLVATYLRNEGYRAVQVEEGEKVLQIFERETPRLVVLDIGLSGTLDGLDVCRKLRSINSTPILILTARDSELDRIIGLELGADDYVTKPFSPRELVARIKAILRRSDPDLQTSILVSGDIVVDVTRHQVRVAEEVIDLAAQEFDLLTYLLRHKGVVLSRRQILDGAWEFGWFGDERTVDVHIRQLRKKLGDALLIHTVWGVGYRLG